MVNISTDINKTNNHISTQIIERKEISIMMALEIQIRG
jgi:hypothetical protein